MPEAAVATPPVNVPDPSAAAPELPLGGDNPVLNESWEGMSKFLSHGDGEAPPAPTPEPPKEPPAKPQDEPETPAETKPPAEPLKAPETPKPSEPAKPLKPVEPEAKTPKELRDQYHKVKTDYERLKADHEKLRADPEKKRLSETIQQREKRIQELDDTIKQSAWERSDDFKTKYEKPLYDAYETGVRRVSQMKVNVEDGEPRPATKEDFDRIMSAPDPEQASQVIEELFGTGTKASSVAAMRDRVLDAAESKNIALSEYQKTFSANEKARMERVQQDQAQSSELWEFLNKKAAETHPEYFGEIEGDEKANELLTKGRERADLAFSNPALPAKELVALHSEIRNKAAAYPRIVHLNQTMKARIAELEKELDAFKTSEPGTGEGVPATGTPQMVDGTEGLDAISIPGQF